MGFLDQLIDPIQCYDGDLTEMTVRKLNYMVSVALLYSDEKLWYEINSHKFTEEQANEHIKKLQEFMPVIGLHTWPHGQGEELRKAIQYQVDKDTLHEIRWKG